ncbi:MAG: hypothetical protein K2P81_00660 [Bacteriovoracaceae bacterium]|nr:hypothetical protein [Bacteriovoracaceae bacterium]
MKMILVFTGALLSFLNLGILWTGVNQWIQSTVALAFFLVSYYVTKNKKSQSFYMLLGSAPLYLLLVQFRDKNGSHLLGITIIASSTLALLLGKWLGHRK